MGGLVVVLILAALVLIALTGVFGWERYRGSETSRRAAGLRPTTEVFIDPETGRRMRVWYDEQTGERDYRPE